MKIVAPPMSPVLELAYMLLKKPATSGFCERTRAVGATKTRSIGSTKALSVIAGLLRCGLTDRASAAGATVLGAPSGCLLHRPLLGAQIERCRGARQLQALVRWQRTSAPLRVDTAQCAPRGLRPSLEWLPAGLSRRPATRLCDPILHPTATPAPLSQLTHERWRFESHANPQGTEALGARRHARPRNAT